MRCPDVAPAEGLTSICPAALHGPTPWTVLAGLPLPGLSHFAGTVEAAGDRCGPWGHAVLSGAGLALLFSKTCFRATWIEPLSMSAFSLFHFCVSEVRVCRLQWGSQG